MNGNARIECPFAGSSSSSSNKNPDSDKYDTENGVNLLSDEGGKSYEDVLQLEMVLKAQKTYSDVHDEHFFIIIHQVHELWFKQILSDINSVIEMFSTKRETDLVDESHMKIINSRLYRVVRILRSLVDSITLLETMSPSDFLNFRDVLSTASGFQSYQFRMLENKLGLKKENRIKYNKCHYTEVFDYNPEYKKELQDVETSDTLSSTIQKWLERTPGLEKDEFDFMNKYKETVNEILKSEKDSIDKMSNASRKKYSVSSFETRKMLFDSIFEEELHNILMARGERRFTHKAFCGALMIKCYSDEPRFHQPNSLLDHLATIDSLLTKWRYNHVLMVQRMLGSQQLGTGGSSGYTYLRTTLSDNYKIFLDLFNLSTFIIRKEYIPKLTPEMISILRTHI
ncbi:tryptophan 2,3-dioxygenase [Lepeophtheirus salmonis]|uniref:Tryptophan 2,3-dioxygenase n=1 Tax=Lepeophtheirus salmonis TaxID=72036 RepID=A0A0K2UEE6_LEPSM|nr:tryptophan 2,3-dioxygenase-like [Lepeophtheirus salmonis]